MQWNPLVPEISVSDFARSLRFSFGAADVRAARDRLAGLGATA